MSGLAGRDGPVPRWPWGPPLRTARRTRMGVPRGWSIPWTDRRGPSRGWRASGPSLVVSGSGGSLSSETEVRGVPGSSGPSGSRSRAGRNLSPVVPDTPARHSYVQGRSGVLEGCPDVVDSPHSEYPLCSDPSSGALEARPGRVVRHTRSRHPVSCTTGRSRDGH